MKLAKKSISISLVAMLLIGMAAIFPVKAINPSLLVNPAATSLTSDTSHVGDTFQIYVDVADVTNMFAYEFKIRFEYAKLKLVSAVRPAGHFLQPVDPSKFSEAVWDINNSISGAYQTGYFGFSLLSPEVGRTGGGHLALLTFQIMQAPGWHETLTSTFDLYDVILVDATATEIVPVDVFDGTYELAWAAPATTHYLSIPANVTILPGAPVLGTTNAFFDVFVDVNNLQYDWWVVGIEFKLAYNGSLIQYSSIVNDTFVSGFGEIYLVDPVFGTVGDLTYLNTAVILLPHSSPPPEWNNPISGTGHLVKITFEVIYQQAFPWKDISPLNLFDVVYVDKAGNEVAHPLPDQNGQVTVNGYILGRQIDLYDQYPSPFGGQGPNMPSDMFWPQKQVELYAAVSYNLWPVQQKLVGFEVRDPHGNVVAILTATTDADGIAHTFYRIPWPCDNPEDLFGVWTVTATVDIACVVVNDTMSFHFDYLVHWIKVTTDKANYAHGETVNVTIEFGSHSQQAHQVLLTADLFDELGYSIGIAYTYLTVSGAVYCTLKDYSVTLPIYINKWVVAGTATLHVNAYSDWPSLAGSPWAPEYMPLPEITILPA
jgi:hypothetical protein